MQCLKLLRTGDMGNVLLFCFVFIAGKDKSTGVDCKVHQVQKIQSELSISPSQLSTQSLIVIR